ncbi:PDR/VanB family oxidoreductase [Streptomyces fuscichromogenes]|uniref:PDR/VanB family oxidoreductase n=1 Tax=Streptomyces fuscichromogenes TaxID=1324013 RepID=UPI00382B4EF7
MSPSTTTEADAFDVRIRTVRLEADQVVSLDLESVGGEPLPAWTSGAHVDVVLPSGQVRQYSLCGDTADPRSYRIAVLRQEAGRGGSVEVHDGLRVGQTLGLRGPRNNFPLGSGNRHLFIAGGIGITPILAHARAAHARGDTWSLVYGARSASSMAFVEELTSLGSGTVELAPQDTHGFLDLDRIVGGLDADCEVYCCGPAGLLDAVTEKVPSPRLHVERFTASQQRAATDGGFEVEFARSRVTVTVGPDQSILDAAIDADLKPLWSCREGLCGTCLTPVVAGEPEHLDDLLDDDERAANDQMLICVSRARSPRLVLDM